MTSQDASNKLDRKEKHSRGEGISDSSATVSIYVALVSLHACISICIDA